jgi:3-phenylpropionate/trans-cinnamate dioxygenase ferredoxin subunit
MMSEKQYNWYKVADSVNEIIFGDNNLAELSIGGKSICLIKKENKILVCTQKCPHAGGRLVDGFIDVQGNIVCPLHRYRFNPETGRNISGEGYFLKTYNIEYREDGIYVGFEKSKGLFGW